jgi:sigma-B regulation protein RsbU (phosphoserine phosphatase)
MLGDVTTEMMLWDLLERLYAFLKPGRGAVLLRNAQGAMTQVAARSRSRGQDFHVELSKTMLEAAIERKEALLINNPMLDSRLAQAQSLMTSGVTSIMTVPLEHGGEVVGIIYMDAGPMRGAFTEEDLRLVAVVSHMAAAKIRTTRLLEELVVKKTMEKEMEVARRIQERLLPDRCPDLEGFELFGINLACWNVSGDLYGFWPGPNGKIWLAIADVSGKGIGPGLLMATFQALMQAWCEDAEDPAKLAKKISLALSKRTTTNRFITAFLVLLDPEARTLTYTNAGHNAIPVLRADGTVDELASQGFPLAMFPGTDYGQGSVSLGRGDLMFLYTDGITEAADPQGVEFDLPMVCRTLAKLGPLPLPDLNAGLIAAVQEHTQGAPATDDRTIVMVRRS